MKSFFILFSTTLLSNAVLLQHKQLNNKSISEQAIERMPDGKKTVIEDEYSLMSDDFANDEVGSDDFIAVYNHEEGNKDDDARYLKITFGKYSE